MGFLMRGLVEKFNTQVPVQKETFRGGKEDVNVRGFSRGETSRIGKFFGIPKSFRGGAEAEMHAFVIQSLQSEYKFSYPLAGSIADISLNNNVEFTEDFLKALISDSALQQKFTSGEVLKAVEEVQKKGKYDFGTIASIMLNQGVTAKFTMKSNVFMLLSSVNDVASQPDVISSNKPAGAWYQGDFYGSEGMRYAVI
ncbi:hypothetical protein A2230_07720 [candidate division WOR-1 bacterium RIFOXYA2_FULL_36_21]|uniref:Uncharacterized protein n=1 Tax=candidate division WOR-1 bacterium RIFOXYB2_FULL_36_35 TaxID=1802578 RepID=A0A1F4RYW8_UNCSA|nr:MAG: hypothetical protein A2230_07720 [candidate division WOR-1 bacterium RIFOXYA2_FULL_36_21]OGC13386.1 MAG: hypothetical protein A2290_02660 [candidate division WOR-1 bacterium RIFOXYB2_FULL_36_35]OGC21248.1 MAG: hypothetical protein A2282_01840 [candidate division WOR-1 bacterium RIFOXYA12_FULL_36_13]